jgi:hypothetical protein
MSKPAFIKVRTKGAGGIVVDRLLPVDAILWIVQASSDNSEVYRVTFKSEYVAQLKATYDDTYMEATINKSDFFVVNDY